MYDKTLMPVAELLFDFYIWQYWQKFLLNSILNNCGLDRCTAKISG